MGKNKLAKFAEMATFEHVFQVPSHVLRSGQAYDMRGKWNNLFFKNANPIVLELGCGKGEYTVGLAELFPEKNFIGIDIKGARMWTGAKLSLEKKLKNVAFLRTNIEMIDLFFGKDEVSEIWLTFPDPQMKKVTKRLTSTGFMRKYLRILKPDALIHLKTDSNFLFTYTSEMIKANQFPVVYSTVDIYAHEQSDKVLNIKTFYEQQWIDRGISIKYIKWIPQEREHFIEPNVDIEKDSYRSFGRNKTVTNTLK